MAGAQPIGDDGKTVEIYDASGKTHTITTPVNGIVGSKKTLTWSGTAGANITKQAWNGVWLIQGTPLWRDRYLTEKRENDLFAALLSSPSAVWRE